jgi:hypothetical protein
LAVNLSYAPAFIYLPRKIPGTHFC